MLTKIRNFNWDWVLLLMIVAVSLTIRVWSLDKIPPNITGDESTYLSEVYRILYSPKQVSLFALGDDGQPALNFYLMAFCTKLIGINKSFLAIRLPTAILSTLALIPFYFLLKEKTARTNAFVFSLLMTSNYWYLNFSRNGWFNANLLLFGLSMFLFLEKGLKTDRKIYFITAGVFGALSLYGYYSGKIFLFAAAIFLIAELFRKDKRLVAKNALIFFLTTIILFFPQLSSILQNPAKYFLRPRSVFVLNASTPYYGQEKGSEIILYQIKTTIQGLVFLEGSVIGQSIENQRYTPPGSPVVDPIIKCLFLLGILLALLRKWKILFWWLIFFFTLILLVIPTIDAPNTARGLLALPVIYFIAGLAAHGLGQIFFKFFPSLKKLGVFLCLLIFLCLFSYNVKRYFSWMITPAAAQARQPAIEYNEFSRWQDYQIEKVKRGQLPITNYEWYEIRKSYDK